MSESPSFHIDPNSGDPRSCSKPDSCGWASPAEHHDSFTSARHAYEAMMRDFLFVRSHKRSGKHTMELVKTR